MDPLTLLNSAEVEKIVREYGITKQEKSQISYNLFSLSSYNSYLENFHSDIVASLLDPRGLHNQGYTFLHLFVDYLKRSLALPVDKSDFRNTVVTRETGRLDIWIRDEDSKRCIIVENKINNAVDMDDQIDRYFLYAEEARKYKVSGVVYLSLDGTKKAPPTLENCSHLVRNIGAFTNKPDDLLSGWLLPCDDAATNRDSSSFLHQYIKLIKHLANQNLDNSTMESLYQFLSTNNGIQTVNTLLDMYRDMSRFRADRFIQSIDNYAPFKKKYRYKPDYWLFENYSVEGNNLKVDVWFASDGSANLVFWNPSKAGPEGRTILTLMLNKANLIDEFSSEISYGENGYKKSFVIGSEHNSMADVDDAVLSFFKKLLLSLG